MRISGRRTFQGEREQVVQRLWGELVPVMFKEEQGGQGAWRGTGESTSRPDPRSSERTEQDLIGCSGNLTLERNGNPLENYQNSWLLNSSYSIITFL